MGEYKQILLHPENKYVGGSQGAFFLLKCKNRHWTCFLLDRASGFFLSGRNCLRLQFEIKEKIY